MCKVSTGLIVKGIIVSIIYLVLAINFVFLSPKTVPSFDKLQVFEVQGNEINCVEDRNKNPKYTKIKGEINGIAIKTYDLGTERCLQVFGMINRFISTTPRPNTYKIYLEEDKVRIFGKSWLLYQVEANGKVLLSYEESSQHYLKSRKLFFYISLGVLAFFTIMIGINIFKRAKK